MVVQVDETNSAIKVEGTLISTSEFARVDGFATSLGRITIAPDGAWTYIFNDAFNSLPKGESLSDSFLLTAVDGTTTALTVTIVGTNDAPNISAPLPSENLVEAGIGVAGNLSTSVTLSKGDVDLGDQANYVMTGWVQIEGSTSYTKETTYGSVVLDISTGNLTYTLDNAKDATQKLNVSDLDKPDPVSITVVDNNGVQNSTEIIFKINGTNDEAVISATASVTVANDVLANAPDSTVYEAGLPTGSNAASNTETATGSFTVSASDGIKELVVGGTTLSLADLKTLSTLS
ncbi:hypothetical protein ICN45_10215, partial [Polynucleobacter sp. UK-Pondora-W15]|nr:hypothetical protein [Polynucleobacter alcilacus]